MNPNPLSANLAHLFNTTPVSPSTRRTGSTDITGGFGNILSAAFANANAANQADRLSSAALITGEADDLSGLMIDAQKAELALSLALQIRNKLVDAYTEVMRISL